MQCPHCFREVNTAGACPYCGFDAAATAGKYPLALHPGSILNGRYILGHVLGQGGFGITYIALDYQTRERVAIKEYLPTDFAGRSTGSPSVLVYSGERAENFAYGKAQFLEEAKTLASFNGNAGIVRIYSYFEENGTAYFCMEYVDGPPLNKYMAEKGGRLSPEEANALLLPLMGSLSVVHARGIVHRDIAPDNILVTADGRAKLIDFGAARYSTGEKSKSLDVILKHGFAPYEQYMRRGRQGPWTDVYAMAATWYYAVTGRVPPEAIERREEDTLVLPSALGVRLNRETEEVLLHALEVSAADRYQSMGEFCHAMMAASDAHRGQAQRGERERLKREEAERREREKAAQREAKRQTAAKKEKTKKSRLPLILGIAAVLALVVFLVTRPSAFPTATNAPTSAPASGSASKEPYTVTTEEYEYVVYKDHAAIRSYANLSNTDNLVIPAAFENKPVTEIMSSAFLGENGMTYVTIPDSVTSIGNLAFSSCIDMERILIPDSVTRIGALAFSDCFALDIVTIPGSVSSIEASAFFACSALESVTIMDGVNSIGAEAFSDCIALKSIAIPATVTSIGEAAFYRCPVQTVYYGGSKEQWYAIDTGEGNESLLSATVIFNGQ